MVNLKQKKGAVELSLNLIIMLIIGMVVLGLIIGFVSQLVSKGTAGFDSQLGDNEKLKLQDIEDNCPDNLCINPSPSITVKKGQKENVYIKLRAVTKNITLEPGSLTSGSAGDLVFELKDSDGEKATGVTLAGPGFDLKSGEEEAKMYTLRADGAEVGTYYLKLLSERDEDDYTDSVTVTLEVQ